MYGACIGACTGVALARHGVVHAWDALVHGACARWCTQHACAQPEYDPPCYYPYHLGDYLDHPRAVHYKFRIGGIHKNDDEVLNTSYIYIS